MFNLTTEFLLHSSFNRRFIYTSSCNLGPIVFPTKHNNQSTKLTRETLQKKKADVWQSRCGVKRKGQKKKSRLKLYSFVLSYTAQLTHFFKAIIFKIHARKKQKAPERCMQFQEHCDYRCSLSQQPAQPSLVLMAANTAAGGKASCTGLTSGRGNIRKSVLIS